jgi:Skp family chaperone for outer membrane proteins
MTGDSGISAGDASDSGGPDVALGELGRAISRAADALAALPANDTATAYRCARALDAAFGDLADLLRSVPGIVGLGDPGRKVSERLEQQRAELARRRSEIAAYRAKLDDLAETERSLAEKTAEADRLRERASELERAERESEAAQLTADHSEVISVLAAWRQADAEVVDGLQAAGYDTGGTALETVRIELNGIRDRLIDLDDRLGPLLREHARAYEEARRPRPL